MADKDCPICRGTGWLNPNVGLKKCSRCTPPYEGVEKIIVLEAGGKSTYDAELIQAIAHIHRLDADQLREWVATAAVQQSRELMLDAPLVRRSLRKSTPCMRAELSKYQRSGRHDCPVSGCGFARVNAKRDGVLASTLEGECRYS